MSAAANRTTDDSERTAVAMRIWKSTVKPRKTLVERYLDSRGLVLPERAEEAIRYYSRCPFMGRQVPAMVALFRDIETDEPRAIHRIALLPDGSDRDRELGRAMLGPCAGTAIKLTRDDEVTRGLGITEGIETGLSLIGAGWRPIWGTGSATAIAKFPVLDGIEELTVFADCDQNRTGQQAAEECAARWIAAGKSTTIWDLSGGLP